MSTEFDQSLALKLAHHAKLTSRRVLKKYLGVFQLQLGQFHQVLPEGSHSSRLEVHQLCGQNRAAQRTGSKETNKNYFLFGSERKVPTLFGRVWDFLKLLAAELLIGLSLQDISVLGPGLVQSFVGILVVHQRATAAVEQVLVCLRMDTWPQRMGMGIFECLVNNSLRFLRPTLI